MRVKDEASLYCVLGGQSSPQRTQHGSSGLWPLCTAWSMCVCVCVCVCVRGFMAFVYGLIYWSLCSTALCMQGALQCAETWPLCTAWSTEVSAVQQCVHARELSEVLKCALSGVMTLSLLLADPVKQSIALKPRGLPPLPVSSHSLLLLPNKRCRNLQYHHCTLAFSQKPPIPPLHFQPSVRLFLSPCHYHTLLSARGVRLVSYCHVCHFTCLSAKNTVQNTKSFWALGTGWYENQTQIHHCYVW